VTIIMAHMTATHLDAERLRKKGWTPGEIEKAKGIFEKAETAKHPEVRFAEHVRLWTIVVAMLAGSVASDHIDCHHATPRDSLRSPSGRGARYAHSAPYAQASRDELARDGIGHHRDDMHRAPRTTL